MYPNVPFPLTISATSSNIGMDFDAALSATCKQNSCIHVLVWEMHQGDWRFKIRDISGKMYRTYRNILERKNRKGRFQTFDWTSSPKGNDCSPESNVPRSICPKTLCSLSPTPMMLHIKFDQDWPLGFRDIQVQKCEILVTQGQVTPKWVVWFGPKSNLTKLLCLPWLPATLMMIRSKMNELAWTMGNFLDAWGQLTP